MSGRINIIGSWFEKIANGFIFGTQSNKFTFKGNVEIEGDGNFEHTFQNKNGIVAHLEDFENGIDFTPIATPTHERGRIYFDDVNDCISFMDNISGTSVQVGYEMLMRARNNTGSTITNGSVVYISGAIGQNPTIALAQSNTEPTSEIIGVATHNIANNTVGKVCVFGLVNDIDTSAFTDGDFLYLSSSVAGGLTATTPSSPNFVVSIGVVEHAHPTQGKILVKPQRALSNNNTLGTSQKVSVTENVVKTALSTKLDKDTTAGVERAYIINADGSQDTKATSEFKDVLEFTDFPSFPTTGETGKIYIALDKNFTYRWTGSAYVQLSGGIDLYPIKYWYQATGTGMGTYGTNVMYFQGTQTDFFSNANGLSYRKIASAATAGTSIFARESSFHRVYPNKGYQFLLRFRIADAATISDVRGFHGLQVTSGFFNTDISANIQPMCGIGCDGTDTNIHIFSRQSVFETLVKIDTGFSKTLNHEYLLTQKRLPNSNDVVFTLKNLTSSTEFTSTVVNNSSNLTIVNHRNNNASALSCGFEIQRQELNLSE